MAAPPRVSPHARRRARRAALQALYQWQFTAQDPSDIEVQFLTDQDTRKLDLSYFRELLRGVCSQVEALDRALTPALDRPLEQVDPVERAILRIGTFELKHRPDIPWRVVINEAVELSKTFGAEQSHRYINGILDKIAQEARPAATNHESKPQR